MSTMTEAAPTPVRATVSGPAPGFGSVLKSESIKLRSLRSTWWIVGLTVVLGVGFTVLMSLDASSGNFDETPESFVTGGLQISQIFAIILGTLVVTNEYGNGMIHSTFAATPSRGKVLAAKALIVSAAMFVLGITTALIGFAIVNPMFDRNGLGMELEGDVLRAMYGSGLYLAGSALFALGLGFLLRHTAAAMSLGLGVMLIVSQLAQAIPGDLGIWISKLMPGNASLVISTPVPFNPNLLDAWAGFGVFAAETAAIVLVAWVLLRRRDA